MNSSSILLVGCGKMGRALLTRWQKTYPSGIRRFRVIEPANKHADTDHISWFSSLDELPKEFSPSVIVFALKPQQLGVIMHDYYERFAKINPLYISVAAGKPLKFYKSFLGPNAHIVRAMPNIPATVGKGITALCSNTLSPSRKELAGNIMQAVGEVIWLDNEEKMDAATALSGSGPAYVFLFLDSLTKAGIKAGLPEETAKQLAIATVSGSCSLAENSSDSFAQLRMNVTSPGGTTEAALNVLMQDDQLENLIQSAILNAVKRAKEM